MAKFNRKAHGKRSKKKGIYISEGVVRAFERNKKDPKKMIKIYDRGSMILNSHINHTAHIHNGKNLIPVVISPLHVGHKFGEFAPTRKPVKHPEKNKGSSKKN